MIASTTSSVVGWSGSISYEHYITDVAVSEGFERMPIWQV